jgi:hypothetical protein
MRLLHGHRPHGLLPLLGVLGGVHRKRRLPLLGELRKAGLQRFLNLLGVGGDDA